ncbi:zona pellucida-like domain-containing protein 1 [Lampris incognitus]|uniref:zona pellucida-like domain-containing protein 1 n=1 Tax=Lampris incognitus TaxID=2546036 RepID=UPI0024B5B464|nr:zona pellucida-like domain-containing protein 1 [Lampris incognitus]
MKTYRTISLATLVCQLGLILRSEAQSQTVCNTHNTYRPPENTDITVVCGTKTMAMSIFLCPVYHALYNESLMALNGQFDNAECYGVPDWSTDPPTLKFNFTIAESDVAVCHNNFKITSEVGTGMFSDFSNVQFVNISGIISSLDPSAGTITYRQQILYMFSCRYPMQYLVNNTQLGVSGVSLAVRDNNGSFISTLSMQLYSDTGYTEPLIVPETGLNLKTRIFVGVKATNLTNRFNVLLDRCYATTSPFPSNSTYYDLFVGCTRDGQTRVELNGVSQMARFSFEAFRFVEHKNLTVSTFYLHCVTRLCEVSRCSALLPDCSSPAAGRRRREASSNQDVPANNMVTVTSPPIMVTKLNNAASSTSQGNSSPLVGVIVAVAILTILFISTAAFLGLYLRRRKTAFQ